MMEKQVLLQVEGLKKYFPVVQGKLLGTCNQAASCCG